MSVVSAVVITKAADFAAKVGMKLLLKFNNGPFHRWAEKKRAQYAIQDAKK